MGPTKGDDASCVSLAVHVCTIGRVHECSYPEWFGLGWSEEDVIVSG